MPFRESSTEGQAQEEVVSMKLVSESNVRCEWTGCKFIGSGSKIYDHLVEAHVTRCTDKKDRSKKLFCRYGDCNVCVTKRDHLTSHLRIHVDFRPHACGICKRRFKRKQDVRKHSRIHEKGLTQKSSRESSRPIIASGNLPKGSFLNSKGNYDVYSNSLLTPPENYAGKYGTLVVDSVDPPSPLNIKLPENSPVPPGAYSAPVKDAVSRGLGSVSKVDSNIIYDTNDVKSGPIVHFDTFLSGVSNIPEMEQDIAFEAEFYTPYMLDTMSYLPMSYSSQERSLNKAVNFKFPWM